MREYIFVSQFNILFCAIGQKKIYLFPIVYYLYIIFFNNLEKKLENHFNSVKNRNKNYAKIIIKQIIK